VEREGSGRTLPNMTLITVICHMEKTHTHIHTVHTVHVLVLPVHDGGGGEGGEKGEVMHSHDI
jgi:hypothetical protein